MSPSMNWPWLTDLACQAARVAGGIIQKGFGQGLARHHKTGLGLSLASQVVTEVDWASQKEIFNILEPSFQPYDLAWLGEESKDSGARLEKDYFWCVDPLDGTLPFVEGKPGFSVSIALVAKNGVPWMGVVLDPIHNVLYHAVRGGGAFRNGEPWHPSSRNQKLTLFYDRSFFSSPFVEKSLAFWDRQARVLGMLGAQLGAIQGGAVSNACQVLEQGPGLYAKAPKTEEGGGSLWDYAATACLFHEVGAVATDFGGQPLELNRLGSTFMNHKGFIFSSDPFWATWVPIWARECLY